MRELHGFVKRTTRSRRGAFRFSISGHDPIGFIHTRNIADGFS